MTSSFAGDKNCLIVLWLIFICATDICLSLSMFSMSFKLLINNPCAVSWSLLLGWQRDFGGAQKGMPFLPPPLMSRGFESTTHCTKPASSNFPAKQSLSNWPTRETHHWNEWTLQDAVAFSVHPEKWLPADFCWCGPQTVTPPSLTTAVSIEWSVNLPTTSWVE